jgi:hypothetical protein
MKRHILAIRDLLADPNNHTQGTYARDVRGREVAAFSPKACAWCFHGALQKLGLHDHADIKNLLNRVSYVLYSRGMIGVNDDLGHEAVIKVINTALEKVEP